MTPAQKKWLTALRERGFVERGGWGRGQRNRPLRALCALGLAYEGYGPKDCLLQVDGFFPVDGPEPTKPPQSETLTFVTTFLGGYP